MVIHYMIEGNTDKINAVDTDDLAELCQFIERELRAKHSSLANQPHLTEKVADGLLNGLAGTEDRVDLGELK